MYFKTERGDCRGSGEWVEVEEGLEGIKGDIKNKINV